MQKTLFIKLSIIAGLCAIFVVALNMISSLIFERQQYSEDVISEIAEQHVNPQQVINPFIIIPTTITPKCDITASTAADKCPEPYTVINSIFASQTDSIQNLEVSTDTYKRGIYHATSYHGTLKFDQQYDFSQAKALLQASEKNHKPTSRTDITNSTNSNSIIHWDKAKLIIPVSDLRGVSTLPTVKINNNETSVTYPQSHMLSNFSYIETALPADILTKLQTSKKTLSASVTENTNPPTATPDNIQASKPSSTSNDMFKVQISLPLAGLSNLSTIPTGENFTLKMSSNWHAPNFMGKALPNQKQISNAGFSANWQNQYLTIANNQKLSHCLSQGDSQCYVSTDSSSLKNGNYRHYTSDTTADTDAVSNSENISLSNFGVSFAEPNDVYLQTERTLKYGLLLILVSFATFFLFEIIKSSRIHPIQYLLVASALLVFYVLLLPLAEQVAFSIAYFTAAIACVGLIGWYSYYLLGNIKRALIFTAILGGLYTAFYGILTIEDLNLLLGAIFCFILIAAVMIATRRIDWYKVA